MATRESRECPCTLSSQYLALIHLEPLVRTLGDVSDLISARRNDASVLAASELADKLSRLARLVRRRSEAYASTLTQRYYEWRSNEIVVVFTLPKVGSSTVWASLQAAGLAAPVYHVHLLSSDAEGLFEDARVEGRHVPNRSEQLREIARIRELVGRGKYARVVTLVRDPVARYISWFFQGWRDNFPSLPEVSDGAIEPRRLAEAQEALLQHSQMVREASSRWFHSELREVFGFDVFASEFPRAKGYRVYQRTGASLLLLRLEDLDRCHKEAFREFLGLEDFQLVPANVGSEKRYRRFYEAFLRYVTLPASVLDEMYSLPYVTHCYSADEIARFRAKWLRRS
jgi:hypothetical protein